MLRYSEVLPAVDLAAHHNGHPDAPDPDTAGLGAGHDETEENRDYHHLLDGRLVRKSLLLYLNNPPQNSLGKHVFLLDPSLTGVIALPSGLVASCLRLALFTTNSILADETCEYIYNLLFSPSVFPIPANYSKRRQTKTKGKMKHNKPSTRKVLSPNPNRRTHLQNPKPTPSYIYFLKKKKE